RARARRDLRALPRAVPRARPARRRPLVAPGALGGGRDRRGSGGRAEPLDRRGAPRWLPRRCAARAPRGDVRCRRRRRAGRGAAPPRRPHPRDGGRAPVPDLRSPQDADCFGFALALAFALAFGAALAFGFAFAFGAALAFGVAFAFALAFGVALAFA